MNQERLETAWNYLTEILRRTDNPRLERLTHDLFNHYYLQHHLLSIPCMLVWDVSINFRLRMAQVPKAYSGYLAGLKQMFSGYITYPDIRFGQIRIGPTFQGAVNVHQQAMVGLPAIVGLNVVDYGRNHLNTPVSSDLLPVAIFQHAGQWVAANNRGFAAHCAGGVKPLRLLPRAPTVDETNRLNEVEGQGNIPNFNYNVGVPHLPHPHSLPSLRMPITTGPNTWTVEAVVDRPAAW